MIIFCNLKKIINQLYQIYFMELYVYHINVVIVIFLHIIRNVLIY